MDMETTKPELHPVPIWRCRDAACRSWIRDEFAPSASPSCPLCGGAMGRSMRHLPKLVKKAKGQPKKREDEWLQ